MVKRPSKTEPNLDFLKGVPEQYHGAILATMAEARAVPTGRKRAAESAASTAVKQEGAQGAPATVRTDGDDGDADDDDDDGDDGEEESDDEEKYDKKIKL